MANIERIQQCIDGQLVCLNQRNEPFTLWAVDSGGYDITGECRFVQRDGRFFLQFYDNQDDGWVLREEFEFTPA